MTQSRLKILHVVLSLEPGGLENGLVNVARGLDPAEFEVHVCCLERGGAFVERLPEPANVTILHKQPGLSPRLIFQLAKVFSRVKPDVVHSHNLGPLIYSALAMSFGARRPLVQGEHGIPVAQRTDKCMRQRRMFYPFCKQVQAVSSGLRQELIDFGMPADKISVILNGVDSKRFAPVSSAAARKKIRLPETGLVIGIVARFDRTKRHIPLMEAFNQIANDFPTARLLMVGEGGDSREEVVSFAKSSPFASRIHLPGFQDKPENFYPAMDLLVSASVSEGLSNVTLEAMSCGVPVLAHTATGNTELIKQGENGMLLNLSTPDEIARGLRTLLATPVRLAEMGRTAREFVLKNFTMESMVENYAKLYRDAAGRTATNTASDSASRSNRKHSSAETLV